MATITLQNYFRLYDKLSGMTGTAQTEAAEFMNTYEIGVVAIPPHRGIAREDKRDVVYKNEATKYAAVVRDIEERHEKGQPVLVGTASVEKSEYLSKLLAKRGVRHEVLNAKNHAREAAIVAQAGRKGAVTVATNMAGRGTDIMLGGNAEFNAVEKMAELGLDPERDAEAYEARWPEVLEQCEAATKTEHDDVLHAGGLYVLGTERHESRRIDNQLRGRSGRQGDPGESRFYLSLSDDLMRLFNPGAAQRLMAIAPDDVPVTGRLITSGIANAQNQVEGRNAEQRKNVLKYDDVLNRQREVVYRDRRRILMGEDIKGQLEQFTEEIITSTITDRTRVGHSEDWDLDELWTALRAVYPISLTQEEVVAEAGGRPRLSSEFLQEQVLSDAKVIYQEREEELGSEAMRNLERRVLLSVIGQRWPEHLYEMDYLKEGIGLRAMAQRDPLVEYQREGHAMFQDMMAAIREQTVVTLFNLEVRKQRTGESGGAVQLTTPQRPAFLRYTAPDEDGEPRAAVDSEQDAQAASGAVGSDAGTTASDSASASEDGEGANRAQRRTRAGKAGKAKRGKRR